MAKIEYFMAYISYLDAIEPLGDAERGRLFTALLQYAKSGEAPQLSGNEKFLFPMMKSQIDRDNAKYAEKCEKSRQSAYQRTVANGSERKRTQANAAKEKEKEKEKTKEKENITSPPTPSEGADERFEKFWSVYPKKIGKGAALKAFKKIKPSAELLQTMVNAVEAQKQSQQWTKDNGQFIPNPATWLNQERWNDELEVKNSEINSNSFTRYNVEAICID